MKLESTPAMALMTAEGLAEFAHIMLENAKELVRKARVKTAEHIPEMRYVPTDTDLVMDGIQRLGNFNEHGAELGDEDWP